jgi:DNA-directed RNA polymerase alpha subunit
MNLFDCNISVKACNCLKCAGITTTEELLKVTNDDFMHMKNLGRNTLEEILEFRETINN